MGVKCAYPEREVVVVVGDYSFQFLMEEVAVAAQYQIPFVIVMVNNEYLGLIRQAELPYDMNFAVDLHYGEGGIDHVKAMEAFGCPARRVEEPGDIRPALEWATAEAHRSRLPVLVEVMVEREANAAMGPSLDADQGVRAAARAGRRHRLVRLRGRQPCRPRSSPAPAGPTERTTDMPLVLKPGTAWSDAYGRCVDLAPEAFNDDRVLNHWGGIWHRDGRTTPARHPRRRHLHRRPPRLDRSAAARAVHAAVDEHRRWRLPRGRSAPPGCRPRSTRWRPTATCCRSCWSGRSASRGSSRPPTSTAASRACAGMSARSPG